MKIGVKVGDVMTRQLVAVKPNESIVNCAKVMANKDVGLVIVRKEGKLLGILTERDVIWALTKKHDLFRVKAGDIMLKKITTIKPSRDIYEALLRMKKQKIRWLPITIKGNIIGLLTLNDILKIEPGLFEIAIANFKIKEEEDKFRRKKDVIAGKEGWLREGECDECGAFGLLFSIDGELICENCKDNREL